MRHRVASAIGRSVAKIGPICSCTSFASTNWLAQIRLQTMRSAQSMSREFVRALIAGLERCQTFDRSHRDGSLVGARLHMAEDFEPRLGDRDGGHLIGIKEDLEPLGALH